MLARPIRLLALCCDYDGTLAHDGVMDAATREALQQVIASGRQVVLVTGRELDDLRRVLGPLDLFARIVAENGALLFNPATMEETPLAAPPPPSFVQALRERGVQPLSVGRCIVATWEPNDATVLQVIRELGLELQVVFNKGAVMVLPSGVNKASGLAAALQSMGLSPHNAVGVGDAENDHAFLALCEVSAAVANALPAVKDAADIVTAGDHGAGVAELAQSLLRDDLAGRARRHRVEIGHAGQELLSIDPQDSTMLIAGTSGSGKSTVARALLERLAAQGYSYCVVDPEGDYASLADAVTLGTPEHAVTVDEATQALQSHGNIVLNLLGIALEDRPAFLARLAPRLAEERAISGQPHWLVIDEAHHMLAPANGSVGEALGAVPDRTVLVTVHADLVLPAALQQINALIVVGSEAVADVQCFAHAARRTIATPAEPFELAQGEALVWLAARDDEACRVALVPLRAEHRRHHRKYAEGALPEDRCFCFRGPQGRLNLRAQNLMLFLQIGEGVDDDTWLHHLRRGDYSTWFARDIKDDALAQAARQIEAQGGSARQTRKAMREAVQSMYTLPA